MSAIITLNTHL